MKDQKIIELSENKSKLEFEVEKLAKALQHINKEHHRISIALEQEEQKLREAAQLRDHALDARNNLVAKA
jgi:hypothetical protein